MTTETDLSAGLVGAAISLLADGRVAVLHSGEDSALNAVATTEIKWATGYPGLRLALERRNQLHLPPQPYTFYRTANDSLAFVCHVDSDGDAKCHVMAVDGVQQFSAISVGRNYWVYKSGQSSTDIFLDAALGRWLLEELPWKVPKLAELSFDEEGRFNVLLNPPNKKYGRKIVVRPGIWFTYNGSVVAVSRADESKWGCTVVLGGHMFGKELGVAPASFYHVTASGAVIWPDDASELPGSLLKLAAISGMALWDTLKIVDADGNEIEIQDFSAGTDAA